VEKALVVNSRDYPSVVSNQVEDLKRSQIRYCLDLREKLYDIISQKPEEKLPDTKMLQQGSLDVPNSVLKGGVTYIQNQSVNIQVNTHVVECLRLIDQMVNTMAMFTMPEVKPFTRRRKSNGGK